MSAYSPALIDLRGKRMSLNERLDALTLPEPNSGCWLWIGQLNRGGYGGVGHREGGKNSHTLLAHRLMYERYKGEIPSGLHLDHKCRVRCCVNPDHLEPVTREENYRRGKLFRQYKPTCSRGHLLTEETIWRDEWGRRQCRVCWRFIRDRDRARARARSQSPYKELIRRVRTVADRAFEIVELVGVLHGSYRGAANAAKKRPCSANTSAEQS